MLLENERMKKLVATMIVVVCMLATFGITFYYVSTVKNNEIEEIRYTYDQEIYTLNNQITDYQDHVVDLNNQVSDLNNETEYLKEWLHYDQNLEFDKLMGRWNLTEGDENIHYPVIWFRSNEYKPGLSSAKIYRNVLLDLPYPDVTNGYSGAYFARYYIEEGEINFERVSSVYPYSIEYSYTLDNDTLYLSSEEIGDATYERTLWYDWP
jgi:cell division protein FtsB